MKIGIFGLLLLIAILPFPLSGQSPEERIELARQRVIDAGLPTDLIDSRVAEGRAKGVAPANIATAVERRGSAMIVAWETLGPVSTRYSPMELAAGTDAIEAGIPAGAIRQVVREARAEDGAFALFVLTILHQERGLPVETALQRVSEAISQGPAALRDLTARSSVRPGNRFGVDGETGDGPPAGAGPSGPGQRPGGGPPAGVPGPERRPERGPPNGGNPGGGPPGGNGPPGQTSG